MILIAELKDEIQLVFDRQAQIYHILGLIKKKFNLGIVVDPQFEEELEGIIFNFDFNF